MARWPTVENGTVRVATPLASGGPTPSTVTVFPPAPDLRSEKVTVPVGGPPWPCTVAVKVTGWLSAEGLADERRAVEVAAWVSEDPSTVSTSRAELGL